MQFFPTAEGYVSVTDETKFNYVYNYTDHLGNIRLSYSYDQSSQELKILEENHYYPFGLKHSNYNEDRVNFIRDENSIYAVLNPVERNKYQYKYNGKEYQDELSLNLYDYGARNYDPAIGRWTGIDPVTHHSMSPYNAFDGNPVFWADPSGADSENDYSKDIFGRDKFGADGMFIPFSERGEADYESYLGEDGTGHFATNNNDDDDDDQEESFNSTKELLKFIDYNIGNSQTIMTDLKTEIVLATKSSLPKGYTLKGNQLYNDKGKMVGGTTVSLFGSSLKSRIYISPNAKSNLYGNINIAHMTIVHEMIHANHRALGLSNYLRFSEAAASTYTYVYLRAYGDGGSTNKYYTDYYKLAIIPVPRAFSWKNLPSIIKTGLK